MQGKEYELAVPYLEKALEYNPNSAWVINLLSDFYTSYVPNTAKYLEYALKGIRLDIAANDSITTSYIYLHVSNAFIQTGFVNEAEKYINRSLLYDPNNPYSGYVKVYIDYAINKDLLETKERLIKALNKDRSRLDIMQEVGKMCYLMRDYEEAYVYYKKFIEIKEAQNLDIYRGEDAKIALVLYNLGMEDEAQKYFDSFKNYAENDRSIYKHLSLAVYYSAKGNTEKAMEEMELFSEEDNYHYWTILFLNIDPLADNIKELPEYKRIFEKIENKFWKDHERIKASLEEKDLL
jgi:tetratricopeptide (TPR) repeat protein